MKIKKMSGWLPAVSVALCVGLTACDKGHDPSEIIALEGFPEETVLQGTAVEFDTIMGVVGSAEVLDTAYLFYLYDSDHFIMQTDKDFNIVGYRARKGQGPDEFSGISTDFGDILADGGFGVADPYKSRLYEYTGENHDSLALVADLWAALGNTEAWRMIQTSDSTVIAILLADEYGIKEVNTRTGERSDWPLGYELDENAQNKNAITSGRALAHNRRNGVTGELYSRLPVVILHDREGNVWKRMSYGNIPATETIEYGTHSPLKGVRLGDKYIYLLCIEEKGQPYAHILVADYEGNAVGKLKIEYANAFTVDEQAGRIIAVNPDVDERGLMVYQLPGFE